MATSAAAATGAAHWAPPAPSSSSSSSSSSMFLWGICVVMLTEMLRSSEGSCRIVVVWEPCAKIGCHHVHWPASAR
nr:unnamed protein product [Digitaria exilis]